jgi:hypothetical protein
MPPIWSSTALPTFMLSVICAVVDKSSSTRVTCASFEPRFAPPIMSAAFSLLASHLACALEAPRSDSTNTDAPRASGERNASA